MWDGLARTLRLDTVAIYSAGRLDRHFHAWECLEVPDDVAINTVGNVSGSNNRITQIYAPGGVAIRPKELKRFGDASPFSPEWLIYSERSVPFLGRDVEIGAIEAMLDDPRPFLWWAVVGGGGVGKSRLALEILLRNSDTWSGGFVEGPPEPAAFAAAQPSSDTVWIVDYAAEDVQRLRRVIPLLAQIAVEAGCKIRLLLLERGINAEAGWWVDLTDSLGSATGWIARSLFRAPLDLGPLQVRARDLLQAIAGELPSPLDDMLSTRLGEHGDDALELWCDGANPLLAQILAARLLDDPAALRNVGTPTRVVELYLARELEQLGRRCRSADLRLRLAILLLFMTTSCFPLPLENEEPARHGDGAPNPSPAFFAGTLPRPAVERALRNPQARGDAMALLSHGLGIDDASGYLEILHEAGFRASRGWAMLPDLLGEVLISFVANSPVTGRALRAKRPDYKSAHLARAYQCAAQIDLDRVTANWARLPDATIYKLLVGLREAGRSSRYSLLIAVQINFRRPAKLSFDVPGFLREGQAHADGRELAGVYAAVRASVLDADGPPAPEALVNSPQSWLMGYLFHLEVLPPHAQIRLARLICRVRNVRALLRRTNAIRLGDVVARVLSAAVSDKTFALWQAHAHEIGQLAEEALDFTTGTLLTALRASTEPTAEDQDEVIARILMSVSFGLIRERLGSRDTSVEVQTRQAILAALELQLPSLRRAVLLRNTAALQARTQPDTILASYLKAIKEIAVINEPAELAATVSDGIHYASAHRDDAVLEQLPAALDALPGGPVPKAAILDYITDGLVALVENPEQQDRTARAVWLAKFGLRFAHGCREPWVEEGLTAVLGNLLAFADREAEARPAAVAVLHEAVALELAGTLSPNVLGAVIAAAMTTNNRWPGIASLPAGVTVEAAGPEVWALAARDLDPSEFAHSIQNISRVVLRSKPDVTPSATVILNFIEPFPNLAETVELLTLLRTARENLTEPLTGL